MPDAVAVMPVDPSAEAERAAVELAAALGLERRPPGDPGDAPLLLVPGPARLELRLAARHDRRGFFVDLGAVLRAPLSRRQPLARAIGEATRSVVDATAGFGGDAARIAASGRRVTAVERSPIVAALLADGVRRASADPRVADLLGGRIIVVTGDARRILPGLPPHDACFVDPMFPAKRRASALPPLAAQLLRMLAGDDPDADELLAAARRCARRVVVKRPDHAPPLASPVTAAFRGKLVRYDVYVRGGEREIVESRE